MTEKAVPAVLSIAGSDSGGGAGIQADLKAFARCGVHGMTAITAITAQNTVGVEAVEMVAPEMIVAQVRAVAEDIGVDAVKIGMLGDAATVAAVVEALGLRRRRPGRARPGDGRRVRRPAARRRRHRRAGQRPAAAGHDRDAEHPRGAGALGARRGRLPGRPRPRRAGCSGPTAVVVTGGHSANLVDLFYDGDEPVEIPGERHSNEAAHGSGCTHSSSLAAFLARGAEPLQAATAARQLASLAVGAGLDGIGKGHGPVDVFDLAARARADAELAAESERGPRPTGVPSQVVRRPPVSRFRP